MKSITEEPLEFPVNGKKYAVPPVGVDAGWKLAPVVLEPEKHAKVKSETLFRLAMGPAYDQMREDGVSLHLVFRAGMAALAHFRVLTEGGSPEAAKVAAEAIWESGIDPKALEQWAADHPDKIPAQSTAEAGASTASTSTTSTRTKGSTPSRRPRKTTSPPSTSSRKKTG